MTVCTVNRLDLLEIVRQKTTLSGVSIIPIELGWIMTSASLSIHRLGDSGEHNRDITFRMVGKGEGETIGYLAK
jgi:hypothetical protein